MYNVWMGCSVDLHWVYTGFTLGLHWVSIRLHWVYTGFTLGLHWVYTGFPLPAASSRFWERWCSLLGMLLRFLTVQTSHHSHDLIATRPCVCTRTRAHAHTYEMTCPDDIHGKFVNPFNLLFIYLNLKKCNPKLTLDHIFLVAWCHMVFAIHYLKS